MIGIAEKSSDLAHISSYRLLSNHYNIKISLLTSYDQLFQILLNFGQFILFQLWAEDVKWTITLIEQEKQMMVMDTS